MEIDTVKMVYMGLVKMVAKELRNEEFVRLPFIGDYYLLDCKPTTRLAGRTKLNQPIMVREERRKSLRAYPHRRLRDYFAQMHKNKHER